MGNCNNTNDETAFATSSGSVSLVVAIRGSQERKRKTANPNAIASIPIPRLERVFETPVETVSEPGMVKLRMLEMNM